MSLLRLLTLQAGMPLGGLRELIATTVEDGGDIGDIPEVAVQATQAMLGPCSLPAPAR